MPERGPEHRAVGVTARPGGSSSRARVYATAITISAVTALVVCAALLIGYRISLDQNRAEIARMATTRARFLATVPVPPSGARDYLERALRDYGGLVAGGGDEEVVIGRADGDSIRFLLAFRGATVQTPQPVSFESHNAVPMQRALAGEVGVTIARDYLGRRVIAGYAPVRGEWHAGIVVKLSLADIRSPFLRAGVIVTGIAFLFIGIGATVLARLWLGHVCSLDESSAKFRNLFNNAEVGMFRSRLDGSEILDANRKFLEIFGRSREEVVGKPSVIHWADPNERARLVQVLEAQGHISAFPCDMLGKSGEVRHCLASLVLYPAEGIAEGSIQDITDLEEAQRSVRASEEKFRALFEQAGDYALVLAAAPEQLVIVDANESACLAHGYSREELLGKSVLDLDVAGLSAEAIEQMTRRVLAGETLHFETLHRRKDGTTFPVEVVAKSVPDPGGATLIFTTERDITVRKRAEEALRESEERYRTLFESIDEGFCIVEVLFDERERPVDLRMLEKNAALEQQVGVATPVGKRVREVVPELEAFWVEIVGRVALSGQPQRFQNHSKELGRWWDVYAFRHGDPRRRQVAILLRDITAQRELDREVLVLTERERERIGRDLHDVLGQHLTAADLILRAMQGRVGAGGAPTAEELAELRELVRSSTAQARFVARGLVPIPGGETGLRDALEDLAVNSSRLFGIACSVRGAARCGALTGSVCTQLYHIAQEAITNAVRHGGATEVAINVDCSDGECVLSILDNGSGLTNSASAVGGRGIMIMKSRASIIGARLVIAGGGNGGSGAVVRCSLPPERRARRRG